MADTTRPANAGVRFPPPLLYAAGFAAGEALQYWHPLAMTAGASPVRVAVTVAGVAAFSALFISAFVTFRRERTTILPHKPVSALATNGPYRITRNPMYLGLVALYVGIAAFANSWWPVILLPLVVAAVDRAVIAREERYLTFAFPAEYSAYCSRVRRWL